METKVPTAEQYKAAKDALYIYSGACNGCGIAGALQDAYRAWLHAEGTDAANRSAPVRLMLHQLCYLAGLHMDSDDCWIAARECEEMVKAYEAAQ